MTIVRFLAVNAMVIDKLKKTALIHAVMSGHTHIASYLISLGASANVADTSGNVADTSDNDAMLWREQDAVVLELPVFTRAQQNDKLQVGNERAV